MNMIIENDSSGVSRLRLLVLRATYLLMVVGLGLTAVPTMFDPDPAARGVIPSLLFGLWLLAGLGLFQPLRMLPLLLFEFIWKSAWLISFGLSQYLSGEVPPTFADDFPAIIFGVLLMPLVIPWGYVVRNFLRSSDASPRGSVVREQMPPV